MLVDLDAVEARMVSTLQMGPGGRELVEEDVPAMIAELRSWRRREAARLRDAESVESIPENVLDAAFASQSEWWSAGDDARRPVIQFEQADEQGNIRPVKDVVIASLIEQVAEATYRATVAERAS